MIAGKTMVQRVYEQALQASSLRQVLVATDDERIFVHVKEFSGNVVMTSVQHHNGTERCAEALQLAGDLDAVINIQGDEPFIRPEQIDLIADCLQNKRVQIATLVKRIETAEEYFSSSVVKVVFGKNNEALYFSRAPVPLVRDANVQAYLAQKNFFKHIGIYGFQATVLREIVQLPPARLESLESLEQLRWLENGYRITVRETQFETQAVDTPEDIPKLKL